MKNYLLPSIALLLFSPAFAKQAPPANYNGLAEVIAGVVKDKSDDCTFTLTHEYCTVQTLDANGQPKTERVWITHRRPDGTLPENHPCFNQKIESVPMFWSQNMAWENVFFATFTDPGCSLLDGQEISGYVRRSGSTFWWEHLYQNHIDTTYYETENNDTGATANIVPDTASKIVGHIGTNTDRDIFKISIGAGLTLQLDMTGPSGNDYDLYLFSATGAQLKSSATNGCTESITFQNVGNSAVDCYILVLGYKGSFSTTEPYGITVTKANLPIIVEVSLKPTTATIRAGETKQFTATVTGSMNQAVTWSCSAGTISDSGLYTAPSTDGLYTVTATSVADSTKSASANVNVDSNYYLITNVSPVDGGTITRDPNAISYTPGTAVTLTVTPANNYTFMGWTGSASGSSKTIQIVMDNNQNITASFLASETKCGIPVFDPAVWNDEGVVQRNNNCYNYSNNVKTNTFAQPGRYCGHLATSMSCADVIAAAECDGLIQTTKDAVLPPGMTRIALVVADGEDYHWYRQDSDGKWSHKPGQTKAINVDNSNALISDPETADRGFYNSFCLYFQVCSGEEQFGGHSTIR